MDGYLKGKPDHGWWVNQVRAGEKFRNDLTHFSRWDTWRKYYRGQFRSDLFPKNLFFMMTRTIVPRTYFRNPSISIIPARPGPLNAALAKILERVDNKLIRQMNVKQELKRMVQNAFMFGTGIGTLGFGAEFTPTPDIGETVAPEDKKGWSIEHRSGILPNMPWFLSVHPGSFVVPSGTEVLKDAFFTAKWVKRSMSSVRDDPRLKNVKHLSSPSRSYHYTETSMGSFYDPREYVDLLEIRDARTGKVFILAPQVSKEILFYADDELHTENGPPIYDLVFNADDEYFWGVPDSKILEPYQLEINEVKKKAMEHRRISIIKILAKKGTIDEEAAIKMLSPDAGAVVEYDGDKGDVDTMLAGGVPQEFYIADQEIMQDVRETMGMSRNQFGEYKPGSSDTTATEAQIVQQASEIRIDERRDMVADVLVNMITDMHRIIFRHWTQEQVIDVVGPEGLPTWVKFTGEMLKVGQYEVKVDPDTSIPETKQAREAKSERMYKLLAPNPMIDPAELTKYVLHEHHGVAFDTMMKQQGPGTAQEPSNVLDFADALSRRQAG